MIFFLENCNDAVGRGGAGRGEGEKKNKKNQGIFNSGSSGIKNCIKSFSVCT
jgi:hypothetical protein